MTDFTNIAVQIISIASNQLEQMCFYTLTLSLGNSIKELVQKKSVVRAGFIQFNQTINIRTLTESIKNKQNKGEITVFSLRGYGKRQLFGHTKIDLSVPTSNTILLPLEQCGDSNSIIQLKIQHNHEASLTNFSRSNSRTSRTISEHKRQEVEQQNIFVKILPSFGEEQQKKKQKVKQQPKNEKKTIYASSDSINMETQQKLINQSSKCCQDILNNIKEIQDLEEQAKDMQCPVSKRVYDQFQRQNPKFEVVETINKMTGKMKNIMENQHFLKMQKKFTQLQEQGYYTMLTNQSLIKKQKQFKSIPEITSNCSIESMTVNFRYATRTRQRKLSIVKCFSQKIDFQEFGQFDSMKDEDFIKEVSAKFAKELAKGMFSPQQMLQVPDQPFRKLSFDEPEINLQTNQNNNFNFIKLSKIQNLTKKMLFAKKRNSYLISANQVLLQNQRLLDKKLYISKKIIEQKEHLLTTEFSILKQQFKQVTNKLKQKYSEEIVRQTKIKAVQDTVEKQVREINDLKELLSNKTKQIHTLRQMLNNQDGNQKNKQREEEKNITSEKCTDRNIKEKQQKFKRSNSQRTVMSEKLPPKLNQSVDKKDKKNRVNPVQVSMISQNRYRKDSRDKISQFSSYMIDKKSVMMKLDEKGNFQKQLAHPRFLRNNNHNQIATQPFLNFDFNFQQATDHNSQTKQKNDKQCETDPKCETDRILI